MMHIVIIFNFFTGNTIGESVRSFKLWLFGIIGSHGGSDGRFIPKTAFNIGNIFIYHKLLQVSCVFVGK